MKRAHKVLDLRRKLGAWNKKKKTNMFLPNAGETWVMNPMVESIKKSSEKHTKLY